MHCPSISTDGLMSPAGQPQCQPAI
jgi:hypothetical protein